LLVPYAGARTGEQGLHMVSLLKKNPAVAINIILGRLQQKVDEW
jgi:histone deacetylase complex regulatory component SIN3